MKHLDNKFDLNQIAKIISVKQSIEEFDDWFIENNYCECSEELQGQGKCECGFEDERDRYVGRYKNAIETVADNLLREHGLTLVPANKKHGDWEKKIVPLVSWKESCIKVLATIEGVGYFDWNGNVKEFVQTESCRSYKDCVISHIHWIKYWSEVYGGNSVEFQIEKLMKY